MLPTCILDSETLGLFGPAAVFQFQFDYYNARHNDKPFLYDPWHQPVWKTVELIEEITASITEVWKWKD